ncbi:MAG: hypothetical protein OEU86_09415 [Gammaproteobacteria bacterium]|nr:hypothetical protein [Gammaproteobacteria bacterium]
MNSRKNSRFGRPAFLPTALLMLAINAGFASVGHAQESSTMVITAERLSDVDYSTELRADAENAVWKTRLSVATGLGAKLQSHRRNFRVAAAASDKRG